MWKRIRKSHRDGRLLLVCIEGEDESVDIGRFDGGKWLSADDSELYPEGMEPTHCDRIPAAAKPSGNIINLHEFTHAGTPKQLLEEFLDTSMDSVIVMTISDERFAYGCSAESVADVIMLIEMVKHRIMSGALNGQA